MVITQLTGEIWVPVLGSVQLASSSTPRLSWNTEESSSFLLAGPIIEQDDGVFQIAGVYQNNPSVHLRGERSEIHHEALLLEVVGDPPNRPEGALLDASGHKK